MTVSLELYLDKHAASPKMRDVTEAVLSLSKAAVTLHGVISRGQTFDAASADASSANPSGDTQKPLDLFADEIFLAAARSSPVGVYGSEEQDDPVFLNTGGSLALAIDPLDGSSNIEINVAIGTIFSLLPLNPGVERDLAGVFAQPGENQLAAGFFIYGAQLLLVLTVGSGTSTFIWTGERFVVVNEAHSIPVAAKEYSINASNRRHWSSSIRSYIEQVEAGEAGPRGNNFGMRYVGSLVADTYRILQRGGVFLYPSDERSGYKTGRLRQIYEANPIAFCIEQAGGEATDGYRRILSIRPEDLHARTPLIFGSRSEVEVIATGFVGERASSPADAA
jgi:fructose-1,6-bisphosphatase I